MNILIVDDNEVVKKTAVSAFKHCAKMLMLKYPDIEINIKSASSGEEAVAAAVMTTFDLIIMDICMPGMDGLEATRSIRCIKTHRDCVIAGFSCLDGKEVTVKMYQAGIDTILNKPARLEQIKKLMETVISMRHGGYPLAL